jgi:hypothetical protein
MAGIVQELLDAGLNYSWAIKAFSLNSGQLPFNIY